MSLEDLSRLFGVSMRSARSWTEGGTRVPNWLTPALQIYRLLPEVARDSLRGSISPGSAPGKTQAEPAKRPNSNKIRHPFARIEEL